MNVTLPISRVSNCWLNGDQRLSQIENLGTDGTTNLSTHGYTYNAEGMILGWTQQAGAGNALTATFGYDAANQLTSAVLPVSLTVNTEHRYRYDKGGNRTSAQIGNAVTAAGHDSGNRVRTLTATGPIRVAGTVDEPANVTVNGQPAAVDGSNAFSADVPLAPGTHTLAIVATDGSSNTTTKNYEVTVGTGTAERTLTYDLNGNLVDDGAGRTFTWDAVNRLLSVTTGGAVTAFVYDGAGRRVIEKLNGTEIRRWVWGGGPQPIEERDSSNAVTKRFYSGLGEQVGGVNYYYTTDHLGSVRELVDDTGAVRARYAYDPFGQRTKVAGDLDATFGFTGFFWHAASGLNLTIYRGYDVSTGRWLSRDPIGERGSINLYGYVDNNPVNYIDPLGLIIQVEGTDGFKSKVGGDLIRIAASDPRLKKMIESLVNAPVVHKIEELQKGTCYNIPDFSKGINISADNMDVPSVTYYNPNQSSMGDDAAAGLVHELYHAWERGVNIPSNYPQLGTRDSNGIKYEEYRAVRTENIFREATGMNSRTTYGSKNGPKAIPGYQGKNSILPE